MARILYFSYDYTPHDHRFLAALAESEHKVFYLRLGRSNRQTEDRPIPAKIELVQWTGGRKQFEWNDVPRLSQGLRQVIHRIRPDLVHAGPIQTCAFLTALVGFRPLLTMSWGFDLMQDAERNTWSRWVTRYTLRRSTFFASDAEITRNKAVAYGMDPERTVVFPWGVDLVHFTAAEPGNSAAGSREQTGKPFTLFCNRSWEPRYGVDVLARSFVVAAQTNPDISLLLLGDGSQAMILRRILEEGGVAERVTFGGVISHANLPRFYRMGDLYISPSHVDGSSVSLMEALACGRPCLVSDIPANREWITEGVNGWLFPDGDAQALTKSILQVYDGRSALSQIGMAARRTAEAKADWTENFGKLLTAYDLTMRAHA